MDLFVFIAVLLSAAMHAGWNAFAKGSGDKLAHFTIMSLSYAAIGAAIVPFCSAYPSNAWAPLIAAAIGHVIYRALLGWGYERGDLSFVYPLSRGSAPLYVGILSIVLASFEASSTAIIGVTAISASVIGFGWQRGAHSWGTFGLALTTGLAIASYSYFGGIAARASGSAIATIAWLGMIDGISFALCSWMWNRRRIISNMRTVYISAIAGGAISFIGYAIAICAMTKADITTVTALRATSVLFAVAIGVFWMRESFGIARIALSALMIVGIVLVKL